MGAQPVPYVPSLTFIHPEVEAAIPLEGQRHYRFLNLILAHVTASGGIFALPQSEVARRMGVVERTVRRWEAHMERLGMVVVDRRQGALRFLRLGPVFARFRLIVGKVVGGLKTALDRTRAMLERTGRLAMSGAQGEARSGVSGARGASPSSEKKSEKNDPYVGVETAAERRAKQEAIDRQVREAYERRRDAGEAPLATQRLGTRGR